MSRFIGSVTTDKGRTTSVGGRDGVAESYIRGWNVGIKVTTVKLKDGDRLDVYMTGGSKGSSAEVFLGSATLMYGDEAPHFEPASLR